MCVRMSHSPSMLVVLLGVLLTLLGVHSFTTRDGRECGDFELEIFFLQDANVCLEATMKVAPQLYKEIADHLVARFGPDNLRVGLAEMGPKTKSASDPSLNTPERNCCFNPKMTLGDDMNQFRRAGETLDYLCQFDAMGDQIYDPLLYAALSGAHFTPWNPDEPDRIVRLVVLWVDWYGYTSTRIDGKDANPDIANGIICEKGAKYPSYEQIAEVLEETNVNVMVFVEAGPTGNNKPETWKEDFQKMGLGKRLSTNLYELTNGAAHISETVQKLVNQLEETSCDVIDGLPGVDPTAGPGTSTTIGPGNSGTTHDGCHDHTHDSESATFVFCMMTAGRRGR